MPLYLYHCCGTETEAFNTVDNRRTNAPKCNECGELMDIRLTPGLFTVQKDCHYKCPVTGQEIVTHRQRRNVMAEHNLVDANDFPPAKAIERQEKAKAHRTELAEGLKKDLLIH